MEKLCGRADIVSVADDSEHIKEVKVYTQVLLHLPRSIKQFQNSKYRTTPSHDTVTNQYNMNTLHRS